MSYPHAIALPGACILAGIVSVWTFRGPAPTATSERNGAAFSTSRAMRHVEAIAQTPHPVGTAAHDAVRDYLERAIRNLGLEPQRMSASFETRRGDQAVVENIIVRLPGREPGPGVMLAAHYDSAPRSPGASDNGVAVAALLETMRALQASEPSRRQVWIVFTDGEEAGLWGARALIEQAELMAEVGLVLNFDARGTWGPDLMFETSDGNAALIAGFARYSPRPLATSLSQFVYRWMPNDTDFSVFKHHGMAGLNFAFIGGYEHYHRASDSIENISLRSLRHTGMHALSLVRHFAAQELPLPRSGDAVFFNLPGALLVNYPLALVRPAAFALVLGMGAWGWMAGRKNRGAAGMVLKSLGTVGLACAVALGLGILGAGLGRLASWSGPGAATIAYAVAAGLGLAIPFGVRLWVARRNCSVSFLEGVLALFVVLTVGTSLALPEGSYLFLWPALFLAIGWSSNIRGCASETGRYFGPLRGISVAVGALLFTALISPLLVYVFLAVPFAVPVLVMLATLAGWLIVAAQEVTVAGTPAES